MVQSHNSADSLNWQDVMHELTHHSMSRLTFFNILLTLFSLCLIGLYWLHRRYGRRTAGDTSELEQGLSDVKDGHLCSPFQAYLGCNALTEPFFPGHHTTSKDVIDLLEQYADGTRILNQQFTDDPPSYQDDVMVEDIIAEEWRNHSYNDSTNRQSSYDSVYSMVDNRSGRRWQRRTMQVVGH